MRILGDFPQLLQIMVKEHWLDMISAFGKPRITAMVRRRTSASVLFGYLCPHLPLLLLQSDITSSLSTPSFLLLCLLLPLPLPHPALLRLWPTKWGVWALNSLSSCLTRELRVSGVVTPVFTCYRQTARIMQARQALYQLSHIPGTCFTPR